MIKRLVSAFILSILLAIGVSAPAMAQLTLTGVGSGGFGASSGGCSQATAFIARETSHVNDTIYTTMICGLVTDGVWAKLDLLYIFAAPNTTDALLNMVGATTTALSATAPTFTANLGYAGNGTSATINVTGYNYSTGTNYTQNAASLFAWSTEAGVDNGYLAGNSANLNSDVSLQSLNFGSSSSVAINAASGLASSTLATGLGLFTAVRTTSTNENVYQNATSVGATTTTASLAIISSSPWFLGSNGIGFFGGGIAAGGVGGGLTGTDVSNLYSRLHTALHAISATNFP